jgi:uncharacterized phage infection (PIP) family protein YhgE
MAGVTAKMDEITAKVKSELGQFLNNQELLLDLRPKLDALKTSAPAVWPALSAEYDKLYSKQAALETTALDWVKNISDLKNSILANPDVAQALANGTPSAAMFSGAFWASAAKYTNTAIPLISQGLVISQNLVSQNGAVSLLQQAIERKTVLVPSAKTFWTSTALLWAYGALGVGAAYLLAKGKKSRGA